MVLSCPDTFISYIVPCYNVEAYLSRCLLSLENQILGFDANIEFILVNDGSNDGTLNLLKEFAAKEKRAKVINQTNKGVSAARNTGLMASKGKYVFFLDSDDWLSEDATLMLYAVCNSDEPDIVVTNAYCVYEKALNVKYEWNLCSGLNSGLYDTMEFARQIGALPISFKAYRRDMLLKNSIYFDEELRVGEVYAFFMKAIVYSHQVAYTDKRIMNYFIRNTSVMRTINIERDITIIDTMHRIDSYVNDHMPELRSTISYKCSLFDLVNMFVVSCYLGKSSYTTEVGLLLSRVNRDKIYIELQKFFVFEEFHFTKRSFYALLFYFLPVSIVYRLLRFAKLLRDMFFYLITYGNRIIN